MASKYKRSKNPNAQKFVKLDRWFYRCPAWRSLSPNARAAYLIFKDRYKGHNNGWIGLSIRTLADEINVGRNVAHRAIQELMEKGFVHLEASSGFNRKNRVSAEYSLSEYANDKTGDLASKKFSRWKPNKKTTVPPVGHTVPSV